MTRHNVAIRVHVWFELKCSKKLLKGGEQTNKLRRSISSKMKNRNHPKIGCGLSMTQRIYYEANRNYIENEINTAEVYIHIYIKFKNSFIKFKNSGTQ